MEDKETVVNEPTELEAAVAAYRQAVVAADPSLPLELIAGSTVAEVDASVEQARAVVARVRDQLRAEAAKSVPATPAGRTPIDPASLSAREKIALGL